MTTENIVNYTDHEINNFKNGKVKIIHQPKDVKEFIEQSIKVSSNKKLYFGKINSLTANKIKKEVKINLNNFNISLSSNAIRHIIKNHGNEQHENKRGQISIKESDFNYIVKIITNFDKIKLSGLSDFNNIVITFEKRINCLYHLVCYISKKNFRIEIKTLYKTK